MKKISSGQVITTNGLKLALNRIFTASPDYTAPTVFKIGTGTTTPTVSDTDVETVVQIDGSDTKAFVTGYPSLDETNMQSTIRALLLSTESNGSSLTEFGVFNEDGTALMFSHSVFTAITKTSSVQISFVEKDIVA